MHWAGTSHLGDPRALQTMRAAVRTAERHEHHDRAARVRRNVAWHMAYRGNSAEAVSEIEKARANLHGIDRARSEVFRVGIYHLADRAAEALPASAEARRMLERLGDTAWEARLSYNRGVVLRQIGDHLAARKELERARDLLMRRSDMWLLLVDARIELGLLPSSEVIFSRHSSSWTRSTPATPPEPRCPGRSTGPR